MFYLVKGKLDKSSLDYSSQIDSFQLKSLHSKIDTKNKQDLDFFCHISDLPGVEKVTTTEFLRLEDLANDPKMHHDTVIMPFTDKEMQEAFSLENGGLNREKINLRDKIREIVQEKNQKEFEEN
ncbi:hypothetical protein M0813_02498 [Anaeramoeba flamelloides]|uniref:Uncharacterized protein n=1 Tax=Anaeramoeba flamelloides TaxID=1746091 RepID=A0AAV7YCD1_9EUKA|nr:hypothetical protein M0812_26734 [Anaeramoeba flamelloides]KAJ3434149.1 hypothetical protein M0812_20214 [Anaeramoeba flamelloides]KAJ6240432.1 hypothetical protein M0813_24145 [Anaeramoeba flamelloides]KAJ6242650.1 hypothetical protein M0813_02498 [Anaeramoeba flamelloides]